jgi:hypothetical protein
VPRLHKSPEGEVEPREYSWNPLVHMLPPSELLNDLRAHRDSLLADNLRMRARPRLARLIHGIAWVRERAVKRILR